MTNKEKIELLKAKPTKQSGLAEYYQDLLDKVGSIKRDYGNYMTTKPINCDEELKRTLTADYDLCCALLTMLFREDHFAEYGCFENRCEKGDVQKIIDRMIFLLEQKEENIKRRLAGRAAEYMMFKDDEENAESKTGISSSNNVIVFPDFEKLKSEVEKMRTELSMLLLERDELQFVICKNIETVPSQGKWTQKSYKKRNESQYFFCFRRDGRIYSTVHLTTSLCRHDVPAKGQKQPRAVRPGKSLSYRLLIVKRLSRHKR